MEDTGDVCGVGRAAGAGPFSHQKTARGGHSGYQVGMFAQGPGSPGRGEVRFRKTDFGVPVQAIDHNGTRYLWP
jgi:hypothetical protein